VAAAHKQAFLTLPPNKRLKPAGGDRFKVIALKETECCAPGGARTNVHYSCARERVARSLSARLRGALNKMASRS